MKKQDYYYKTDPDDEQPGGQPGQPGPQGPPGPPPTDPDPDPDPE